jgi:hypothetical protein
MIKKFFPALGRYDLDYLFNDENEYNRGYRRNKEVRGKNCKYF